MISISDSAQAHFVKLLADQPAGTHIRVFVISPGTSQAECGVSYCPPDAVEDDDLELEFNGFKALVDEKSVVYLEEASIDFVTDQMGSQLTLKAPNAKMRKVSGDAPLVERIEYVIQSEINPQLASHGGNIMLVEITDDGVAVLQFGGGCNGCSQVDITLKDGIEKQLLDLFSGELTGVRDVTDHKHGEHSYT
jgi:Fe/S biogenesis protein NfuA